MKNIFHLFVLLLLGTSCVEKKKENPKNLDSKTMEVHTGPEKLDFDENSKENLKDWLRYYRKEVPDFSLEKFKLQYVDTLDFISGNVPGSFDQEFDKVYYDFIVHNQDGTKYIDFDSYQWSLDENGKFILSPDQEINVVDLKKRTVTRIGFRGPSYWVENAFWENGSTIVLLENSSEKQPTINRLDLESRVMETYTYQDTLTFKSNYFERRMKEKGIGDL